jgi:hypothetical protein
MDIRTDWIAVLVDSNAAEQKYAQSVPMCFIHNDPASFEKFLRLVEFVAVRRAQRNALLQGKRTCKYVVIIDVENPANKPALTYCVKRLVQFIDVQYMPINTIQIGKQAIEFANENSFRLSVE